MQIDYDKDEMYVTFKGTLRLDESITIPPLSECIVDSVLRNKVSDMNNMMVCSNTLNRFITSIVGGRTLAQIKPRQHTFPVLLTNTKHVPVTLITNMIARHGLTLDQEDIIPMSEQFSILNELPLNKEQNQKQIFLQRGVQDNNNINKQHMGTMHT